MLPLSSEGEAGCMMLAIQGMAGKSAWATTSESRTGSSGRWETHWQGRAQVSVGLQATPALQGALDNWWCARAVEPTPRLLSECATGCDSAAKSGRR